MLVNMNWEEDINDTIEALDAIEHFTPEETQDYLDILEEYMDNWLNN